MDSIQVPIWLRKEIVAHATIDAEDLVLVNTVRRWRMRGKAGRQKPSGYVIGSGKRFPKVIDMHRLIMGDPPGLKIDHIDRDPLNNRKSNLRFATDAQNCWNQGPRKDPTKTSRFKGVYRVGNHWVASIRNGGKQHRFAGFHTERQAARAYDTLARLLHGEFAYQNFPADAQPTPPVNGTRS